MKDYERINRFIDCYQKDGYATDFSSGIVCIYGSGYMVGYEQMGARATFSVGQPVYDEDGNLMGYLGIGLYENLDYATGGELDRVPVEHWTICLPTPHCNVNKRIYTYWQNRQRGNGNGEQRESNVSN